MNYSCYLCGSKDLTLRVLSPFKYNETTYQYFRCGSCGLVTLHPRLAEGDAACLYSPSYHAVHYPEPTFTTASARRSLSFLQPYLKCEMSILDYGCGSGEFISICSASGYHSVGSEIDPLHCNLLSKKTGIRVLTPSQLFESTLKFDIIRVADVLEHLPDPQSTLISICQHLKPSGFLFIEGPLEDQPSLVHLSMRAFALIARLIRRPVRYGEPYHLVRFNAKNFNKLVLSVPELSISKIEIYDDGWPYANNRFLKSYIAYLSVVFSRICKYWIPMGNRIQALYSSRK